MNYEQAEKLYNVYQALRKLEGVIEGAKGLEIYSHSLKAFNALRDYARTNEYGGDRLWSTFSFIECDIEEICAEHGYNVQKFIYGLCDWIIDGEDEDYIRDIPVKELKQLVNLCDEFELFLFAILHY